MCVWIRKQINRGYETHISNNNNNNFIHLEERWERLLYFSYSCLCLRFQKRGKGKWRICMVLYEERRERIHLVDSCLVPHAPEKITPPFTTIRTFYTVYRIPKRYHTDSAKIISNRMIWIWIWRWIWIWIWIWITAKQQQGQRRYYYY